MRFKCLSGQDASTSGFLDFALSVAREETGLDDDGLVGQTAFAEHLEETLFGAVDDWSTTFALFFQLDTQVFVDQSPQLFHVDGRAEMGQRVFAHVEVAHANLSKVSGMVLVHVGLQVVLTTGHTATTRVLTVLADTTTTMAHVATQFTRLPQPGRLQWHKRTVNEQTEKQSEAKQRLVGRKSITKIKCRLSNEKLTKNN